MATIRDRYILEIDTKGSAAGISQISAATTQLKGGLGGIKTAAAGAVGALASLGAVNLAKNAVETYTAYETLTTQIATYTGGLKNARAELSRLEDLSVQLPQDLNDIAEAFTILTRNGIDTSAESLRKFSDIAAANGKSLTQLAEAVADGMTGEFERFKEFGIKVSKEGDQLVARIGDQQVAVAESASQLVNQLAELGAEGGKFFGAGAANAETLSQSFSNLNGAISIVERSFVEGLKPGLQAAVEGFTNLVTNNKDLLQSFGELIGGALSALPGAFVAVSEAVAPLKPLFELLGTIITEILWPALKLIFEILGEVAKVLQPIVEAMLPAFKTALDFVGDAIRLVVEKIGEFVLAIQKISENVTQMVDRVKNKFSEMKSGITDAAKGAYDGVTGWFGDMYNEVVGNSIVPDMVERVLQEFDFLADGMAQKTYDGVTRATQAFDRGAQSLSSQFSSYAQQGLSGIGGMVDQLTNGLYSRVTGLFDSFKSVSSNFKSLTSSFSNIFKGGGNPLSNIANVITGGSNLFGQLKNIGSSVKNVFSGITGGIKKIFGGLFANGGYLPAGKLGIVGERQPELIMGPASIRPSANGSPLNVYINAVDAASFQQLVARDPEFIYAVAQRGARSFR